MDKASEFHGLVLALSIVVALVNCFFGYRLQRIWIGFICFFVGLIGGIVFCTSIIPGMSITIAALVGVALGALLAMLSFRLYLVGVFLFAAGISFWTCVLLITANLWIGCTVGVAAGLLVGFLAVRFTRTVMILSTGITGGLSAFQSLLLLVPIAAVHEILWLPFVGGGILAVVGIVVQYRVDSRRMQRKKAQADAKAARTAARQETAKLSPESLESVLAPQQAHVSSALSTPAPAAPMPLPLDVEDEEQDEESDEDAWDEED